MLHSFPITNIQNSLFSVAHVLTSKDHMMATPVLSITDCLTLSVRMEYIYSVASQATSPAPFKYLFNKYPY
jgi:hypothetical protein